MQYSTRVFLPSFSLSQSQSNSASIFVDEGNFAIIGTTLTTDQLMLCPGELIGDYAADTPLLLVVLTMIRICYDTLWGLIYIYINTHTQTHTMRCILTNWLVYIAIGSALQSPVGQCVRVCECLFVDVCIWEQ